ncbi:MAG: hypothetical protein HYR88_07030 [Verrucomicrobia bacterium]|nr:hypothetical protein [Verrucomicrobiota bacterium]MBI3869584.1 hypothetical protein [Verrucomicrobiota bacterium]
MALSGKKLGILVSVAPDAPNFHHALGAAGAAIDAGVVVYLYCIDEAVRGVGHPDLQALRGRGLILYACAYGAHRREIPLTDHATFAGLTVVNDLMAATDRFLSFN